MEQREETMYLPRRPPADLTPFAFHKFTKERLVGARTKQHVGIIPREGYPTETNKVGRRIDEALAERRVEHNRHNTDVTRVPVKGLRPPSRAAVSEDDVTKLLQYRQMRQDNRNRARQERVKPCTSGGTAQRTSSKHVAAANNFVDMFRKAQEESMNRQIYMIKDYVYG
eukprot:766066-Hanusia_phi.AAC.3